MAQERPVPAPRNQPILPKKQKKRPSVLGSDFHVTCISPLSVVYNKYEPVIMVFNQSLPSNVEFTIKFVGLQSKNETSCAAQKIGDNVLTFRAPEHYPPEEVEISVHHGNHLTKLCDCRSFYFKSYLQQLRDTLVHASDPIEFMCASLHLKQKNVVALDFELEKRFVRNMSPRINLLSNDQVTRMEETAGHEADPTLLHFAARYNLIKLAIAILRCPGGYNTLNMCNIDGYNPIQLAEQCGHENLAFVLGDAQQHHNIRLEPDEIYEAMHDPIYESYITLVGTSQDEEIYVTMDSKEDETYERMVNLYDEEVYANIEPVPSGIAAETTSIMSTSSTSSSESSASNGSGAGNSRPRLPPPRHNRSYDEATFREQTRYIVREVKSFDTNRPRNVPGRGSFQDESQSPYSRHREISPPAKPSRNPNINY